MAEWDAFLSYSSHDSEAAARVQRFLERYRLPDGRRLRVYRDETDISGGQPVVRTDRNLFRRVRKPWWRTRLDSRAWPW